METSISSLDLSNRTLLGIWAHPDDETYLSAGLITRTVRSGGRVATVHATLGERGTDEPRTWPPGRMKARRAMELQRALKVLGVRDSEILGYPDGGCDQVADIDAIERIEWTILRVNPDVVVTFGPDGITGHDDHVTVGRWATAAWLRTRGATLLYATCSESFIRRNRRLHERHRVFYDPPAPTPDADIALKVELTAPQLAIKRAALAGHASQTVGLAAAMGERVYRRWWDVETFRLPTEAEVAAVSAATGGIRAR